MRHDRSRGVICQYARDFLCGLLAILAVVALATLDMRSAHSAEPSASSIPAVNSATLHVGALQAERISSDIHIEVTGGIARASVTQIFRRPAGQPSTALFLFPLPEAASVDTLSLKIGDQTIETGIISVLKPVRPAARTVEAAPASRLPELSAGQFAVSIPDIGSAELITVRFQYQHVIQPRSGVYSLVFPLAGDDPESANTPERVSLSVHLAAGFDIGDIGSRHHVVFIRHIGDREAVLTLAGSTSDGRDLEIAWAPKAAAAPQTAMFVEDAGTAAYAMAMIAPPKTNVAMQRELVFLLDTSGSMTGVAIDQARASIVAAIERLGIHDRFNIILFNEQLTPLFDGPRDANPTNFAAAADFLRRIEPHGGGDMLAAISAGLREANREETSRLRQIITITDGRIAPRPEMFAEIAARRGKARVFFAGIGSAPDARLLQRAAHIGRGEAHSVADRNGTGDMLDRLLARIERPAITDLKIVWPADARPDVSPDPLPDVYAGEPLMIVSRLNAAKGKVVLSGTIDNKPWKVALTPASVMPKSGLSRQWARNKIALIAAQGLSGKPAQETLEAIGKIALAHAIASPATTFAATESGAGNPPMALSVRQGGIAVSGPAAADSAAIASGAKNVSHVGDDAQMLASPAASQTNYLAIIAMSLLFAAMTALTMALWRQLRRAYAPAPRRRRYN
ncbi:MAG: VWA domain-containing protein [Pseudomonadota bacterium]|nr:VWA domain-containing protein [Pseudomonadota bacterium]